MLYVGHFSFFGPEDPETPSSGFFSAIAEADGPEAALDKFAELLQNLKENDDVFEGVDDVFLDQCTEIKSVPEGGFLDYWMAVDPEPVGSITTSLRGVTPEEATAFVIGPDDEEEGAEGEEGDEDEAGSMPFICWHSDEDMEEDAGE